MKKIFKYKSFLIMVSLFLGLVVQAQVKDTSDIMMGMIKDGDTIIHKNIQEIWVMPEREFETRRDRRQYNRLVSRVKKVLPYAKLAGDMLQQYEPIYMELESDREKKKLMKDLEQQLLDQYKDEMKRMTISEGRILLKLIDREADRTSFTLIKEFRGGFSAFFWQGIARLFGSDLKSEYDPEGEDRVLEEIVTLVEVGYL
jgi:hypothetical protein